MRGKWAAMAGVALTCMLYTGCSAAAAMPEAANTSLSMEAAEAESEIGIETEESGGIGAAAAALDAFCAQQPGSFSVYLQDLSTGESYSYGENTLYYGASTLKVPFALWLCGRADADAIDLDTGIDNVFYGQAALYAGTDLEAYTNSASIPARTAMQAMLGDSDNNATTLLAAAWPAAFDTGFTEYVEGLGFSAAGTCSVTEDGGLAGELTVTELAAAMQALYAYTESDAANALFLRACFGQPGYKALYLPAGYHVVSKYGSWDGAFHDAAIVYAPHPYLLCCMTDQGDSTVDFPPEPVAAMQTLGQMAWECLNG